MLGQMRAAFSRLYATFYPSCSPEDRATWGMMHERLLDHSVVSGLFGSGAARKNVRVDDGSGAQVTGRARKLRRTMRRCACSGA